MLSRLIRAVLAACGRTGTRRECERRLDQARQVYQSGDLRDAAYLCKQIISRDTNHFKAKFLLAVIQGRLASYGAAEALLRELLVQDPQFVDGWNALANLAKAQEKWDDAEASYRRARALQPDSSEIWSNLGLCLREAGRLEEAEQALRRADELSPDSPTVLLNLAMTAIDSADQVRARELLGRVLDLEPENAEAHTGAAHMMLQNGDYARGWPEYEWRFRCQDTGIERDHGIPKWDGRPAMGSTLLVRVEQGLGDQLMFASCFGDAIARVGHAVIECEPRLQSIFARSFPTADCFPYHAKQKPAWINMDRPPELEIHMGSLPGLFRRAAGDFPVHRGYLRADPARTAKWREGMNRLGSGIKVGISWRGGLSRTRRSLRSIPLAEWLPVLRNDKAQFISLQYGDCIAEIEELKRTTDIAIHHWQDAIDEYEDTAALVAAVDCVISVQTAAAHLAGALGKQALVLVPATPEWRYGAQGECMPWYPSLRLLRQTRRDNWAPVIERAATWLAEGIATSTHA